jgi:hypothetical protein
MRMCICALDSCKIFSLNDSLTEKVDKYHPTIDESNRWLHCSTFIQVKAVESFHFTVKSLENGKTGELSKRKYG